MKPKKCKFSECGKKFTPSPFRPLQSCCDWQCAIGYGNELLDKKEKKSWKERKAKLKSATKTISDERNDLQDIFNEWIRLRDKDLPCISCGTENPNIKYDASHYFCVADFPSVRFDEDNVHKSCSNYCNVHKRGNLINYRPELILKIGQERFNELSTRATQQVNHYTKAEIIEMKKSYREKIRALKLK